MTSTFACSFPSTTVVVSAPTVRKLRTTLSPVTKPPMFAPTKPALASVSVPKLPFVLMKLTVWPSTATPAAIVSDALPYKSIWPLPTTLRLPENVAVVVPPPLVPITFMKPSFSKYWPPAVEDVPPLKVQDVDVEIGVNVFVALTNTMP